MKHIISCDQFDREGLLALFRLTDAIRADPAKYRHVLGGKLVATMFYEPSTRTRLSFEAAVQRLGGGLLSTENAKEMSSAVKGESLKDSIRVLQGYCDAIVLRHYDAGSSSDAVAVATVPILNAGAGSAEHPTQALLDMYTIFHKKGRLDNLAVLIAGDLKYGRTIHSLIKLLSLFDGVKIYALSIPALALPDEYAGFLSAKGIPLTVCRSFDEAPKDMDVIYHTRSQLERFKGGEEVTESFIIDQKVLDTFSKDTVLLHPLPRNAEISPEVDGDPRACYFEQAHNGMYIRMALLCDVLG